MKAPIVNWIFALIFMLSRYFGEKPAIEHMMGHTVAAPRIYGSSSIPGGCATVALGAINLAVAFGLSEALWIQFKVFGNFVLTFLFVVGQMPMLAKYIETDDIERIEPAKTRQQSPPQHPRRYPTSIFTKDRGRTIPVSACVFFRRLLTLSLRPKADLRSETADQHCVPLGKLALTAPEQLARIAFNSDLQFYPGAEFEEQPASLSDSPENRVLAIKMRGRQVRDEKLAAICAGTRIRHGQHTLSVVFQ